MQMQKNWAIRLATFGLWLLAASSCVFWALRFVQGTATPANAAVVGSTAAPAIDSAALARGLGGGIVPVSATAPATASNSNITAARFVLTGVVAGKAQRQSLALIAVDGKPARPYRVGASLTDGVVLKSVQGRQADLATSADSPVALTLELPKQTSALVGTAIPAPPVPQPAPVVTLPQTPTAASATLAPGATTDSSTLTGQNPARAGAMRARIGKEVGKEAPKVESPASAGAASQ